MKLMKHITIALVLCAIPAMALGQVADCEDCDHQLSVYRSGGLVATAADGAEMVNYRATCNNVTRTGQMTPDDDGIVNKLLTGELACEADDGTFEIGPITDGGWFWIHIGDNSAVGNIVATDVLMNDATDITDAGDSITMMEGAGAVLLTHPATGRTGLLPTILPEPHMDPAPVNRCSFTTSGMTHTRETSNCMLGNGGTAILVQGPTDVFTRMRAHLAANAAVTRPAAEGTSVTVDADLWGNGSGHYTSDASADARLGHPGGTRLTATISAELNPTGAGDGTTIGGAGSEVAGMSIDASTTASLGVLSIGPDTAYCNPTANPPVNHTATVTFTAMVDDSNRTQVVPSIVTVPATGNGVAARHTIMVVCPTASANMGVELVPDNPFPTDK